MLRLCGLGNALTRKGLFELARLAGLQLTTQTSHQRGAGVELAADVTVPRASAMPPGDGQGAAAPSAAHGQASRFSRSGHTERKSNTRLRALRALLGRGGVDWLDRPAWALSTTSEGAARRKLASCALVGSGSVRNSAGGAALGREIDSHELVVRVNRVPADDAAIEAFGSRTDVWFGKVCAATFPGRDGDRPLVFDVPLMKLSGRQGEDFAKCDVVGGLGCPMERGAVILLRAEHADSKRCNQSFRFAGVRRVLHAVGTSALNVGQQRASVRQAAEQLRASASRFAGKPTSGLIALLGLSSSCERLTLYGFRGESTRDRRTGHKISADHRIHNEHKLLEYIAHTSNDAIRIA